MLSKVWSAATLGIDAVRIVIEVDSGLGQPGFTLVGLPDAAVREAYSRVRSALANCGFYMPARHITVNLSPADVKKEGSGFDLPIALGILHAAEFLSDEHVAGRVFVGELSLDGTLAPVRGALSISAALASLDPVRELIVPAANANEAAAVKTVRVIGAPHLPALIAHLREQSPIAPAMSHIVDDAPRNGADLSEVRGQAHAKRALEVAAAGGPSAIAEQVRFRGWLPFAEARDAMSRATVLVHPSDGLGDGLPNVLREAMALGTHVSASRVAGIPEALDDGRCGIRVPPKDVAAPRLKDAPVLPVYEG